MVDVDSCCLRKLRCFLSVGMMKMDMMWLVIMLIRGCMKNGVLVFIFRGRELLVVCVMDIEDKGDLLIKIRFMINGGISDFLV